MSELIAICAACNHPVGAGRGHLGIDMQALRTYREAAEQWNADHPEASTMAALLHHPELVSWVVHHETCEPNTCGYCIPVAEISTFKGLIKWTGHLMEKAWLTDTDWNSLLTDAADGTDKRLRPAPPNPRIADRDIALIRDRNPLTGLVAESHDLTKVGGAYVGGCCPFCESEPISITASIEYFHCSKCQAGGDVIAWVRQVKGVSFNEAIELLAKRAGVNLTYEAGI